MEPEITQDAFSARFIATIMAAEDRYDGSPAELRNYAEQAAASYWEDPDQRSEGPEACAQSDIGYWAD